MQDVISGIIDLDRSASTSLYRQLYEQLRDAILNGRLPAGTGIPATRTMAVQLGVARNTVLSAVEQLTAEGFLDARQGSGTVVASDLSSELTSAATQRMRTGERSHRLSATGERMAGIQRAVAGGDEPIPFAPGIPDTGAFPAAIWGRLLRREAQRLNPSTVAYGWTAGHPRLRQQLCIHLREMRGIQADPDQLIITSSAQAALDLLARALSGPGDTVWLEDPGYLGARAAFLGAGAKLVPVPVDENGINPTGDYQRPRIIYVTPSHQYPTGRLMPLARRLELLDCAGCHDAYVVEDDYDSEFQFQGRPVAALQGLDQTGRVIYVGTFSKILQPGIRAGYAVVPKGLAAPLVQMHRNTGQIVSAAIQLAMAAFIEEGHLRAHVRRMCALYNERQGVLVDTLETQMPGVFKIERPMGGMQLIAELNEGRDDIALAVTLGQAGINAQPVSRYYLGTAKRHGFLLGYAGYPEKAIVGAVKQMAGAMSA